MRNVRVSSAHDIADFRAAAENILDRLYMETDRRKVGLTDHIRIVYQENELGHRCTNR